MPTDNAGRVWLVGAGPGDPGLLALRAVEVLANADVVLYDALVAEPVLEYVPETCERVFVGKRGTHHALEQPAIEALMIDLARKGKTVVRLKGGDPFVFGRGAEEAEALRAAGVAFGIVPGMSSAIAGPAYAGIPLTHRAHNAAFTVATGHEDVTKAASTLDWTKLAGARQTLIFLMGMAHLEEIARELTAHGLSGDTPAAVVQNATRPTQRTLVATLATIAETAERAGAGSPALLVIGEVVSLRPTVRWFDEWPLFGKRVLVTRPAARAAELARALRACGAEPIVAPVIAIEPPSDSAAMLRAVEDVRAYRWIVFTSQEGVDVFFERLGALGADARALGGVKVAAIGTKTAARLERRGVRAEVTPAEFVGEALARALIERSSAGDRVLVFRAQEARDVLPRTLARAGLQPEVVAAYRTVAIDDCELTEKVARCDALTFTSAGCVRAFATLLGGAPAASAATAGKLCAYIGPIAADAGRAAGLPVDAVAPSYTIDGLIQALEKRAARA